MVVVTQVLSAVFPGMCLPQNALLAQIRRYIPGRVTKLRLSLTVICVACRRSPPLARLCTWQIGPRIVMRTGPVRRTLCRLWTVARLTAVSLKDLPLERATSKCLVESR